VLCRFDCLLAPTKGAVLEEYPAIKKKPETVVRGLLQKITKRPFYNLSKLDFKKLLDDPNQLAPNLNSYINKYSANVRDNSGNSQEWGVAWLVDRSNSSTAGGKFQKINLTTGSGDREAHSGQRCRPWLLFQR
jgi:hypothetical protein